MRTSWLSKHQPKSKPEEKRTLDFPGSLAREYPLTFPAAWDSAELLISRVRGGDFSALERNSPGLKGFDWPAYLRCSVPRVVLALEALRKHASRPTRILDFGAYFGNFALAAKQLGYDVAAADFYTTFEGAFSPVTRCFQERGISIVDFDRAGVDLPDLSSAFDAVLCMGVIEHVPHTPKSVFDTIDRVLRPGGLLILDTPNQAYIYKRKRLMRGESIFPDIRTQYYSEVPFAGHHREYTASEVSWLLAQIDHEVLSTEMLSVSLYSLEFLAGEDLENYHIMESDPSTRELILTVSRKRLHKTEERQSR